MTKAFKKHTRLVLNLYPPFLGAGIRVKRLQADWKAVDVEMKCRKFCTRESGNQHSGWWRVVSE